MNSEADTLAANAFSESRLGALVLSQDADDDDDSLLFSWPRGEEALDRANKLKGLLLALKGLLSALSGQLIRTVTLESLAPLPPGTPAASRGLKGGFAIFSTSLLVLLLPGSLPDGVVESLVGFIAGVATFVLGPPDTWMPVLRSDAAVESSFSQLLDDCFAYFFTGPTQSVTHLIASLGVGVPSFHAPSDIQLRLSAMLTQLEVFCARAEERLLAPAEGCFLDWKCAALFHRGLLVQSHMPQEYARDVYRFCATHRFFNRTEDNPRVVLVKDVWLCCATSQKNAEGGTAGAPAWDMGFGAGGAAAATSGGYRGGVDASTQNVGLPARGLLPSDRLERAVIAVVASGVDLLCLLFFPVKSARAQGLRHSLEVERMLLKVHQLQQEGLSDVLDEAMLASPIDWLCSAIIDDAGFLEDASSGGGNAGAQQEGFFRSLFGPRKPAPLPRVRPSLHHESCLFSIVSFNGASGFILCPLHLVRSLMAPITPPNASTLAVQGASVPAGSFLSSAGLGVWGRRMSGADGSDMRPAARVEADIYATWMFIRSALLRCQQLAPSHGDRGGNDAGTEGEQGPDMYLRLSWCNEGL
eukprot:jgi/Mesvir1/3214/Mv16365-RA.2